MYPLAELSYEAASAQSRGRREYQEDSIACDFPVGVGMGFAVLADGMGGHAAGDIASKIAVTEVFSELKFNGGDPECLTGIGDILRNAVLGANECLRFHAEQNPETEGMGTTLVAPVLMGDSLHWISVGDSPLYLFRDGQLSRLNEDHSMGPQINYMVDNGLLDSRQGALHPDRNCLTSVLIGGPIAQIDCPAEPVRLYPDDIIVVASDGLQFLADQEISSLIAAHADRSSAEIGTVLLREIEALDDPDQDNISVCVIRVSEKREALEEPSVSVGAMQGTEQRVIRNRNGFAFMASSSKADSRNVMTYRLSMEKSA